MNQEEIGARPNSGRMADYWLGGFHNLEIDRIAAQQVVQALPDAGNIAIAQRRFLQRAVAHLCQQGIKRFLDLGSGLPTTGNTHEVARSYHPDAQAVYADLDPITVTSAQTVIKAEPGIWFLQADARDPQDFFGRPEVLALLAPEEPVGFVMVGIMHFMNDDEAHNIATTAADRLPPGSFFVCSQVTDDYRENYPPEEFQRAQVVYARSGTPFYTRSLDEIRALIAPWQITEDGIHLLEQWRPDPDDDISVFGDQ
jgi:SAM-dependent methyltransferase